MSNSKAEYIVNDENHSGVNVFIKKPSNRYVDRLIKSRCGPDLLASGVFPNTKEVTESYACLRAAERIGLDFQDPDYTVFCVGDGTTPRTGATFAYNTAWQCYSIDPALRDIDYRKILRLNVYACEISETRFTAQKAVIVACHSHAKLSETVEQIRALERHIISMQCCVDDDLEARPTLQYYDWGVHSPERLVRIWVNYPACPPAGGWAQRGCE